MAIIDLLQLKGEDAMPPGVMLSAHIVAKGVEVGAVIGLAIGLVACLPVAGGRFKARFPSFFETLKTSGGSLHGRARAQVRRVMEVVEYTVSLCTVIAGVQVLNKARSIDAEGIRERSHRLQHMDPDKARADVAFIVGGTAASLLFAANAFQEWVGNTVVERMVRGFAFGGAVGFISTAGGVERIWKVGARWSGTDSRARGAAGSFSPRCALPTATGQS